MASRPFLAGAIACLLTAPLAAQNFAHIPSASDTATSLSSLPARTLALMDHLAKEPVLPFMERNVGGFYKPILARMQLGHDLTEVNQQILDPKVKPFAKYGTDISIAGGLCKRNGDYDFMMIGLIQMLYNDPHQRLWPETRRKIMRELITTQGQEHYEHFWLGICGRHRDTENHILMTESSRYLVNQLLHDEEPSNPAWDNARGGFDQWMLKHLQEYMLHHFDEYNSRPYQVYTLIGLYNLAAYARNPQVKEAARMVIDYLDVIWSVQNNHGRRVVPFRRQPRFLAEPRLASGDGEMARMLYLTGHYPWLAHNTPSGQVEYGSHIMLFAALSDASMASPIRDFLFDFNSRHYFQAFHHQNVEIYASHPDYLISAGGHWHNRFDMATGENDGSPRPTTLILSRQHHQVEHDFIRFEGHPKLKHRRNSCVLPNFMCGLNLKLPVWLSRDAHRCRTDKDGVIYYRLDQTCPVNYGVHLAIRLEKVPKVWRWWYGENFGTLEIRPSSELSFEGFTSRVQKSNTRLKLLGESRTVTTSGESLRFKVVRQKKFQWEILESSKSLYFDDIKKWPRAWGDIMNEAGPAHFSVTFPTNKLQAYQLDFSRVERPLRPWR